VTFAVLPVTGMAVSDVFVVLAADLLVTNTPYIQRHYTVPATRYLVPGTRYLLGIVDAECVKRLDDTY